MTAAHRPQQEADAQRRLPHYAWVAGFLLCLLGVLYIVSRPVPVAGADTVRSATAHALGPGLPVQEKAVSLPHIMDDDEPGWQKRVDYELAWPVALAYTRPGDSRLAVVLPRVGARFRLLLNGQELYSAGWDAPAQSNVLAAWAPHFVALPPALLAPVATDNRLRIEVQGRLLERSGLWPVQIGDHDLIRKRYDTLYGWQVTGTWMMVMASLLMGLMALFLWVLMRERLFGLMAMASLAHLVRLLLSVLQEPPLSYDAYFLCHRIAFTAYVAFFCLFMESLFGYRLRMVRVLSHGLLVVGPLWMLLTLWTGEYDLYRWWAAGLALVALVMLVEVVRHSRWMRDMNADQRLVMVVAVFTFITGVRDFLVVQLNFPGDADIRWTTLGGLAMMLAMGWVLLQRATESLREVRRLNLSLAKTVTEREAELHTAFNQLRQSEQQRVIESERRRLMRDMHDGVGSQLVQTLNMVRNTRQELDPEAVASMVNRALEELRITLDSLEPMDGDLPTILGTLRQRIAPALESAGIELDWQVQEVDPLPGLGASAVMHLFRCLQEVFANVAKHAHARKVMVRTWQDEAGVHLSIQDDGRGMGHPPGQVYPVGGRGLNNIRVRAGKMGARLHIHDSPSGVRVEFVFQAGAEGERTLPPDTILPSQL